MQENFVPFKFMHEQSILYIAIHKHLRNVILAKIVDISSAFICFTFDRFLHLEDFQLRLLDIMLTQHESIRN